MTKKKRCSSTIWYLIFIYFVILKLFICVLWCRMIDSCYSPYGFIQFTDSNLCLNITLKRNYFISFI
jgi:hypothetical protein